MDLPKRLSEDAKRSDMYSKKDYDERLKRARAQKSSSPLGFVEPGMLLLGNRGINSLDRRQACPPCVSIEHVVNDGLLGEGCSKIFQVKARHARQISRLSTLCLQARSGGNKGFGRQGR